MSWLDFTANICGWIVALLDCLIFLVTVPYFRIYKRNTRDPLTAIAKERDNARLESMIEDWIKSKKSEFDYISIAGAVLFASVPTCLSWPNITTVHWTARAFWYGSILLAATSVVVAAQQSMILSNLQKQKYTVVRDKLTKTWSAQPRRTMLHILQIPIQCLSYSMACFLAGFLSFVFSPLAASLVWDGSAQIAIAFGIFIVFIGLNFVWSSTLIYHIDA